MKPKIKLQVFSGAHCGPCHAFKPVIKQFIEAHPEVELVEVLVTGNINEAKKSGVKSVPTSIVYKDDVEFTRFVGMRSKSSLELLLDEAMV